MGRTAKNNPHKSIIRSAGIISFATLCSRILGFVRDVVIARLFGVYVYAQAFVIAFRIPNLLRDMIGEGAANAALVPVFSEYAAKRTKEEFWELSNVVLNLLLVLLMGITILGMIFSPFIVRFIAPGFIADPYKLETTIRLTRIIFPYILLISLAAYATGVLNSLKHFSIPAFAPCLLNISMIVFALIFGEGIKGLSLGVLAGGVLQLVIQVPVLYKKGFRPRLFRRFRHPEAKTIGKLMLPRLFSSGVYQLNNFVDSIFGSLAFIVGEGGVAILYFAYRLIQFPLGVFSNALSQAILPALSTQALEQGHDNLKRTLSFGVRAIFFVMLPASIGFMVLSHPIIYGLFGGGKFDSYSIAQTGDTLFFYSIGLVFYGMIKMLQSCFFALKDTITPAKVSVLSLVLNIVFNSIFMFPLKIAGLALATSLSATISCLVLLSFLRKKLGAFGFRKIAGSFVRILMAGIGMGGACFIFSRSYAMPDGNLWSRLFNLAALISIGLASYIIFCFIFRVSEMRELWKWVGSRKGPPPKATIPDV